MAEPNESHLSEDIKAILKKNLQAAADAERAQRDADARAAEAATQVTASQAETTAALTRAAQAERVSAALMAGLPAEMATRLQGDTSEALLADAQQLAAQLGTSAPTPSFDGGSRPPVPTKSIDEQIVEAESKGEWGLAGRLKAQKLVQSAQPTT